MSDSLTPNSNGSVSRPTASPRATGAARAASDSEAPLRAALLDLAQSIDLVVAVVGADGSLIVPPVNERGWWPLVRGRLPASESCPFCLQDPHAQACLPDALTASEPVVVHDKLGFCHVTVPVFLMDDPKARAAILAGRAVAAGGGASEALVALAALTAGDGADVQAQLRDGLARERTRSDDELAAVGRLLATCGGALLRSHAAVAPRGAVPAWDSWLESGLTESVRESQRFHRSVLDSLSAHIAVLDEAGRICEVNRAWDEFAGLHQDSDRAGGIGTDYLEASERAGGPRGDGAHAARGIRDVLAGQADRFEMEYPWQGRQERRWFTMRVTRLASAGRVRAVVSHEDITSRRQAEEALRTADRRKDEFLATLAHELRNPLAPIQSALQVMKLLGDGDQQLRGAREVVERQLLHMTRLVDDLLDVSRITRGKIRLKLEQVDLGSVVRRAIEATRPFIDAGRHTLIVELPSEPLRVNGDPVRRGQIVGNLLHNAAKYTPHGGRLQLILRRDGEQARILIRDSGIGISPEMLPRIFDLFVQADRETEQVQAGLGIGLALARKLVELHSGAISVTSEGLGKGTEFVVQLPLLPPELMRPQRAPVEAGRAPAAAASVLVVDDNVDSAVMLSTFLSLMGYSVRTAHDGPSALAELRAAPVDVAIFDIGMPRMDGYELARRIAQEGLQRPRLLVALSGYGRDQDKRRSSEAGFDEHLVKPVDPEGLHQTIKERLDKGGK